MELKTRKEMDAAYQWDLSPIFPDQAAWEKAYAAAAQAVDAVGALAGTLGASSAQMKAGLDTIYETLQAVERVYLYASLLKNSDNGDAEYQRMEGMAMNLYVAMSTKCAFVDPEILALPEETLRAYMEDPALASYRHILEDTNRARAHTLDEQGERLLAMLSDAAGTPDNCFTMRKRGYGVPCDPQRTGRKEVRLTHGNYALFRVSADQRGAQGSLRSVPWHISELSEYYCRPVCRRASSWTITTPGPEAMTAPALGRCCQAMCRFRYTIAWWRSGTRGAWHYEAVPPAAQKGVGTIRVEYVRSLLSHGRKYRPAPDV